MAVNPSTFGVCPQFELASGAPAVGNLLFFYAAGTTTKVNTYTSSTGTTPNANPIVLNSLGQPPSEIWFTNGQSYKMVYAPSTDTDPPTNPIRTFDNLYGINDTTLAASQSEWIASTLVPTFVNATSFTVPGNQTAILEFDRRIKTTNTAGTVYSTIISSVFTTLTTITVANDSGSLDSGISAISYGLLSASNKSIPPDLAFTSKVYEAFTTGGSNTAYTLTPIPPTLALSANQQYLVTFNAAAGVTPTLAVSGLTAKNLKYYDSSGSKVAVNSIQVPNGWKSRVQYDGTDYIVLDIPITTSSSKIQPLSAAVAANALTFTLQPTTLDFRSTTLGSGTVTTVSNGAALTTTISTSSTAGTSNGVQSDIYVAAINNAGTMELAWINGYPGDETALISTTAEGGAGAADSANVWYSTTARTNVAYRVVGLIRSTQATAGTWATAPSLIQGIGGRALPSSPNIAAWCYFNGNTAGTNAPTAGFNVTSVTRNAVGDYTVNLATNAVADALYAYNVSFGVNGGNQTSGTNINENNARAEVAPTTTGFRFTTFFSAFLDPKYIYVSVYR